MKPIAIAAPAALLAAGASALFADDLEALLPKLGAENLDEQKAARESFEDACLKASRPGAEEERAAAAKTVVALLGKEIAVPVRVWLLRQLWLIGGAECVEALTGLLGHADAEVRDAARRALQKNAAPEAGAALRKVLAGAGDAPARIAFLNAIGGRSEAEGVEAAAKFLSDADAGVVSAAAAALGAIGGPVAEKALADARAKAPASVRQRIADGGFQCAEKHLKAGRYDAAAAIYKACDADAEPPRVREAARQGLAAVDLSRKAGKTTYPAGK